MQVLDLFNNVLLFSGLATPKNLTHKSRVYHGKIEESAIEGDEVQLDITLSMNNRNKLTGGIQALLAALF